MGSLLDEALKEKYRISGIHDPLAYAKDAIDWSVFPNLLKDLYRNDTDQGGRPNIPLTTMVKVLFLQSMYNLVDEQAEKEIRDRISFMNFLDYPDHLPDAKIIWYLTCTITELEHHNDNIIEKNRYIKSMRKVVFQIVEVSS